MKMYLSCLLIDTGINPDRPRPGRLWLRNMYRVHQRLCMGFPSAARIAADDEFLQPFRPEDFGLASGPRPPRSGGSGFLYRLDPLPHGRAAVLVQSALEPDWGYAFQNARHLLAADPVVKPWAFCIADGERYRFRLRANAVRRVASPNPGRDGPRVPVLPTEEHLRGWLVRRAKPGGFDVEDLTAMVPGYASWRRSKDEGAVRLRSVLYEGTLRVERADDFRGTLARGIGPAKAFGFGLLSIAPA